MLGEVQSPFSSQLHHWMGVHYHQQDLSPTGFIGGLEGLEMNLPKVSCSALSLQSLLELLVVLCLQLLACFQAK